MTSYEDAFRMCIREVQHSLWQQRNAQTADFVIRQALSAPSRLIP
jgi:hypothetical protein